MYATFCCRCVIGLDIRGILAYGKVQYIYTQYLRGLLLCGYFLGRTKQSIILQSINVPTFCLMYAARAYMSTETCRRTAGKAAAASYATT